MLGKDKMANNKIEIGRIPKEWKVARLKESEEINLIMGQSPPGKSYNKKGEGLPFIQGKAEFGNMCPSPILWTTQPTKIAEEGDILISVRAPVGDVNICPYRLCIGRGLAAIRIKKGSNIFYFYWFQKEKQRIENIGKGSTFKAITKDELLNLLIPLPPLPEQKKIAEILLTVDKAIEKVDEAIEKTERLKKGLMQELLTKGIGHKEFKDTEIGRIPKEWKVVEIREIGDVFTGKTPPTSKNIYWDGNIPFITPEDITEEKYVYKTNRYVTREGAKHSGRILPPNTVIVVCIGSTVGKVAIISKESVTNQQINSIICNEGICNDYIYYAISFRSVMLKNFSGVAAVPIIKKSLFEKFKIPVPKKFKEQQKIAEILSTVDKRLELLRNKKEKLERIKKGLMNDLLTGKRRAWRMKEGE